MTDQKFLTMVVDLLTPRSRHGSHINLPKCSHQSWRARENLESGSLLGSDDEDFSVYDDDSFQRRRKRSGTWP